jgi:hypothetical protein
MVAQVLRVKKQPDARPQPQLTTTLSVLRDVVLLDRRLTINDEVANHLQIILSFILF